MSGLEFTAVVVGHLIWPVVVLTIVVIFRRGIADLVRDVTEGEAGPGGVKFRRRYRDGEARVQEAVRDAIETTGDATSRPSAVPPGLETGARKPEPAQELPPAPDPYEAFYAETNPPGAIKRRTGG